MMVRALKGLESAISVSVVHPTWGKTRPDDDSDGTTDGSLKTSPIRLSRIQPGMDHLIAKAAFQILSMGSLLFAICTTK